MYFVTVEQLQQLDGLGYAGDRNEFRRGNQDGFLVPKSEANVALENSGVTYTAADSDYAGIELLSIGSTDGATKKKSNKDEEVPTAGVLTVEAPEATWDGRGRQKYIDIAKEEFEGIYRKVVMTVPNGDPVPPNDADNDLNIHIWSSPNPEAEIGGPDLTLQPPEKLFGKNVLCRDYAFQPSGIKKAVSIKDEESDFVMMEYLAPNYLYFTWDAVEKDAKASEHIFRECLKAFKEEIGVETLKKEVSKIAKKREEMERKKLIEFVSQAMEQEFKEARQRVEQLTNEIEQHRTNLTMKIRERDTRMIMVDCPMAQDLEKKANKMIRNLYSINHVKDIRMVDKAIDVYTDEIRVTDPRTDRVHILGEFKIHISCQGTQEVRIYNETHQIHAYNDGMQAPHVFPDGRPCLGDLVQSLPEVQARHDYSTIANLVILFLESVNTDDAAGKYVHRWPRLEEDGSISNYKDRPADEREVA